MPLSWALTQAPVAKATSIIMNPLKAEATPAASGNGATQPDCPQGWHTPLALLPPFYLFMLGHGIHQPAAATAMTRPPPLTLSSPPMATVRVRPKRAMSARHKKVPAK